MARCLLSAVASPDETDFTDTSVLQSAMQSKKSEIARLLYPCARTSLILITASNWRKLFHPFYRCDLEVADGEEAKFFPVENLREHLYQLSYPLPTFSMTRAIISQDHFMQQHRNKTRML